MKFNQTVNLVKVLESNPTAIMNHEGSLSFKTNDELELYRLASTCFLEDKFYETAKDQMVRIKSLVSKTDRSFVLSLANYCRNFLNLRSISVLLLVLAAMKQDNPKEPKGIVTKYVSKIVKRADEITEVFSCYLGLNGGKKHNFPNSLKNGLALALNNFDEYSLGKYKQGTKSVKLKDIVKLVRPKPKDENQSSLFKKVVNDTLDVPDTWETYISKNGSNKENWEHIAPKMGFMAMLRNLRNFTTHGAVSAVDLAVSNLTDAKEVSRSRQLPFRFVTAEREVSDNRLKDALRTALNLSVSNMTKLHGKTAIFVDLSGSMRSRLSRNSTMNCREIASLLAAMTRSICDDVIVIAYGDRAEEIFISEHDSILTNKQRIDAVNVGNSTHAYKAVQILKDGNTQVDRIVVLSDEQSYFEYQSGAETSFAYQWKTYKNSLQNKNAQLFTINLNGYTGVMVPESSKDVVMLSGWSEKVIDFINAYENSDDVIKNIKEKW